MKKINKVPTKGHERTQNLNYPQNENVTTQRERGFNQRNKFEI